MVQLAALYIIALDWKTSLQLTSDRRVLPMINQTFSYCFRVPVIYILGCFGLSQNANVTFREVLLIAYIGI